MASSRRPWDAIVGQIAALRGAHAEGVAAGFVVRDSCRMHAIGNMEGRGKELSWELQHSKVRAAKYKSRWELTRHVPLRISIPQQSVTSKLTRAPTNTQKLVH